MNKIVRMAISPYKRVDDEIVTVATPYLYAPYTKYLNIELSLRRNRLRYLPRFIEHAPPLLKALVQTEAKQTDSWAALINDDLLWI